MIEVQIKDRAKYNELKQYAGYSSDLTQVCSFRDEIAPILEENGIAFDKPEVSKDKPKITIQGKNIMKLVNASPEMLYFVGCRTEFDPTIPVRYMDEVVQLIEQKLVVRTKRFNEVYSPIGYRAKISELVCGGVKFYGKGRLYDFIDKDLTFQSMNFNSCKENKIYYKQMKVRVLEPMEDKGKYMQVKASYGKQPVIIRIYGGKTNNLLKSIFYKNHEVNIATSKVTDADISGGKTLMVFDPIILPEGMHYRYASVFTPPNRKIPYDLYRFARSEFMYRYTANEMGEGE